MKRFLSYTSDFGSQLLIYDPKKAENLIELEYSNISYARGCAMVDGGITFFLYEEFGFADYSIFEGRPDSCWIYDKTSEGTVLSETGEICISEPEAIGVTFALPPGEYHVVFGYRKTDIEDFLEIDVFFELQSQPIFD